MSDRATPPMTGFTLGFGRGLVFVYAIAPDGGARELSLSEAEDALARRQGLVWIHLDITSMLAKTWIDAQEWLPPLAKEMLVTHEKRTQIHGAGDALTGIVCDFHHELTEIDWRVNTMHFFANSHCLVTGRRHALAAVERTQRDLARGLKAASGVELLSAIMDSLADLLDGASEEIGRAIEHAEERIEKGEPQEGRGALADARQQAVLFHRQLLAERRIFARLIARPPAWFKPGDSAALQGAVEHLSSTAEELETLQLRARLLQDELAAQLAENTNRNLYVLSAVSAILLPMTLISGIYGMNLGGIPGQNAPFGFAAGVAEIALVGLVTAVLLKILKIL